MNETERKMTDRLMTLMKEYEALCHAMQTGVAAMMNYRDNETEPKHLRVGVNSALIDSGAIAELLISKGVLTREELFETLNKKLKEEVLRYEKEISDITGRDVTLA